MQWVDWAILIVIGLSAGISLMRGFVREALSLAGWVIAFFVAKGFYQDFSVLLNDHIETPSLRYAVAWASLFIITLTATGLVNYIIGQLVEKAGLSGMDRIMGMAFGALRGVLVVSLVVIGLRVFTPVEQDPWWRQSQLIPHVEIIGNWFYDHFKDSIPKVNPELPFGNES
ncbi:CvpA family protein [Aliikangiella coralliicola]|uniref:CvpA family protein n=1 Tax=Aliikangiella coralliicola TaxID=2592383 RepID=A0A545UCZ4_9GAMM|nr:CvpA family protein [Aliikangiella coralliicola]TQV87337.1 CvpA family protein [Aliikangiella coralliicola]